MRYIGASNHSGYQLQKAIETSRRWAWSPIPASSRNTASSAARPSGSCCPLCQAEGVGVIPWSPLRGGWLSGKYHRGMVEPPHGTRVGDQEDGTSWRANNSEHTFNVIDA